MLQKIKKMLFNPFKIMKKSNSLVIKKDNKELISIFIDNDNSVSVNFHSDIKLNFLSNVNINGQADIDVTTFDHEIRVDTWNSNLYLNSYNSKSIKDLPEAIEKRNKIAEEMKRRAEQIKELQEETERNLVIDCTCESCKGNN